jgi:WD40 repeat protein
MRRHQGIIAEAALHVYRSALPFTDPSSFIYETYSRDSISRMPKVLSSAPKAWCSSRHLGNHELTVQQATFSPDGSKVAASLTDGTLAMWELESDTCIGLYRPAPNIKSITFTPDGSKIVTDTGGSEALLWDGESVEFSDVRFKGHMGRVTAVIVSRDGKYSITGSSDRTIRFWNLETGVMDGEPLRGHSEGVESLTLSRDGRFLASTGGIECAIWQIEGKNLVYLATGLHDGVKAVDFVPETDLLLTGGENGTLVLTDFVQKKNRATLQSHASPVTCLTASLDGKLAVSGDEKGRVCLWDLQRLAQIGETRIFHQSAIFTLSISQDQHRLVSTSRDNTFLISELATGQRIGGPFAAEDPSFSCISISPDQSKVLMGGASGGIKIWDLHDMETNESPSEDIHTGAISRLFLSPDMLTVVSCADGDTTGRVWNLKTGKARGSLTGHSEGISCVAFSGRGDLLATGSYDNTVRIWKVEDGSPHGEPLTGHLEEVTALVFSADGTSLVSGSKDATLHIWNVNTGEARYPSLKDHTEGISAIVTLRSGKILSASEDGTTRIWERVDGEEGEEGEAKMTSSVFITHTGPVPPGGMIVSSDEKLLACAPRNTKLEMWSLQPTTASLIKNAHRPNMFSQGHFAFSDDDNFIWFGDDAWPTSGSR